MLVIDMLLILSEANQSEVTSFIGGGSFIAPPKSIEAKNACVNVRNFSDNLCFLYSIRAKMFYDTISPNLRQDPNTYRPTHRQPVVSVFGTNDRRKVLSRLHSETHVWRQLDNLRPSFHD